MTWFFHHISTIILCIVLIAVVAAIVAHLVKNKRRGKSSCGCGCQSCAMAEICRDGSSKSSENPQNEC